MNRPAPHPGASLRGHPREAYRWTLTPEGGELLPPEVRDLNYLLDPVRAERVKHGPHRSVWRVQLASEVVYVKQSRVWTLRSLARECLRGPKSRLEYRQALRLLERGIGTAVPLGWAVQDSWRPGPSLLVTRALHGAVQLNAFLEATFTGPDAQVPMRQRLARALGRFMARLHEAGVTHTDLHPGNLLVDPERMEFYLLDLHDLELGRPLAEAATRRNLALFNRWFVMRASRGDRLRFWRAYADARQLPRTLAVLLERDTWESNQRFWQSRDQRCRKNNRYFQRLRGRRVAGHAVRDLPAEIRRSLLNNPDAPFEAPGAKILKSSRSSTVMELPVRLDDGTTRVMIWKRFRLRGWTDPLANCLRTSPALHSWQMGHGLIDRGLPTPRPWLVLHRRRFGLPAEGYLLCEKVPAAGELHRHVETRTTDELRPLTDQLALLLQRLHQTGLSHRDLKAMNLLVDAGGRAWFIDLVGVRKHAQVPSAVRVQNLMRLALSFRQAPQVTHSVRLRFLKSYLGDGLHREALNWKRWWGLVSEAMRAKIAGNRKRGRPLG